jgi:hypothetical protein
MVSQERAPTGSVHQNDRCLLREHVQAHPDFQQPALGFPAFAEERSLPPGEQLSFDRSLLCHLELANDHIGDFSCNFNWFALTSVGKNNDGESLVRYAKDGIVESSRGTFMQKPRAFVVRLDEPTKTIGGTTAIIQPRGRERFFKKGRANKRLRIQRLIPFEEIVDR